MPSRNGFSLAARSVAWAMLFPGTVAGFIPWWCFGLRDVGLRPGNTAHMAGLLLMILGALLLAACIAQFARVGRGTLSPADPPRELVVTGLYRYVRNPMYLAVFLVLVGESLLVQRAAFALYVLGWLLLVHLFILRYEEPRLHRQFGAEYTDYLHHVRRWMPGRPYEQATRQVT